MKATRIATIGCLALGSGLSFGQDAATIIQQCGLKAGVISHLGATDGRFETDAAKAGVFVVHGLSLDNDSRDQARAALMQAGQYGVASVETYPSCAKLPYPERFVSLLVADMDALGAKAPSEAEIDRALIPLGWSYLKKGGTWTAAQKPMTPGLDGWSHFHYDTYATDCSKDAFCAPINTMKWVTGVSDVGAPAQGSPTNPNTQCGFRADDGKVAYNVNCVWKPDWSGLDWNPGTRHFISRDAYNGVPFFFLRPGPGQNPGMYRYGTVFKGKYIYTQLNRNDYTSMIDGSTGQVVRVFTKGLKSLVTDGGNVGEDLYNLVDGGKLYQVAGSAIAILDINTGNVINSATLKDYKATHMVIVPKDNALYLALGGGTVSTWRFPTAAAVSFIARYDLTTLAEAWRVAPPEPNVTRLAYQERRNLLIGFNGGRGDAGSGNPRIFAMDPATGAVKWWGPKGDGDVHMNMVLWKDTAWMEDRFATLDTGFIFTDYRSFNVPYNMRCVPGRASANFLALGFTDFLALNERDAKGFPKMYRSFATRSSCGMPTFPAYGQWYFSPTACQCLQNKLVGFMSLARETRWDTVPANARLESGDAYYGASKQNPAYTVAAPAPAKNEPLFADMQTTNFPYNRDSLTPPVDGGDRTFVGVTRSHRVEARSKAGALLWSFVAGGHIAPAMAYLDGKLYFASHDGYVYCLNGSDGKLQWRFLGAPGLRKVYAYGELESSWPIYGVTPYNGQIAFCAGRNAELDGGMFVYSLDPATGALRWQARISINNINVWVGPAGEKANTSITQSNQAIGWDGSKLKIGSVTIDPGNPQNYLQGEAPQIAVRVALPAWGMGKAAHGKPILGQVDQVDGMLRAHITGVGAYAVRVLDARGVEVNRSSGQGPAIYMTPTDRLAAGAYVVKVRMAGREEARPTTLRR